MLEYKIGLAYGPALSLSHMESRFGEQGASPLSRDLTETEDRLLSHRADAALLVCRTREHQSAWRVAPHLVAPHGARSKWGSRPCLAELRPSGLACRPVRSSARAEQPSGLFARA